MTGSKLKPIIIGPLEYTSAHRRHPLRLNYGASPSQKYRMREGSETLVEDRATDP